MSGSTTLPRLPDGLTGGGLLQSYWVGVVPLAAAVLVALVWLGSRRKRGRSWRRAVAYGTVGVLFAVMGVAGMANAYVGYVPNFTAAARLVGLPDSAVRSLPFLGGSAGSSGNVSTVALADAAGAVPSSTMWIYTPSGYDTPGNKTRYPVIYLLHGYRGGAADWFAAGGIDTVMDELIKSGAMPPAIVVAPDMNGGGQRDTEGLNVVGGPQIANYLTKTVPAWVDSQLRTKPDPSSRVIGGMSAGGYAALNLGLLHQKTFGAIIALEPYGDPGSGGLAALGGDRAAFAANSPSTYIPTMTMTRPPAVFIDAGGNSGAATTIERIANQLRGRGLPVHFQVEPGQGHTWKEAQAGIPYGLLYVAKQLGW